MTPDAAFLEFFAGPFQRLLETTEIPGMPTSSWDRKAAFLLFMATDKGRTLKAPSPPPPPQPSGVFD